MKTLILLLAAALALAGCGSGPPPPTYGDAFQGLYNQSAADVPADAPISMPQPVGIIFSENVEKYFQWVKAGNEYSAARIPTALTDTVLLADNDPNYITGRVLAMLKQHFPNSAVAKDFRDAAASGKKSVCLVDVVPHIMTGWGDRNTRFDITLYLFDARMNPVSRITGHGEHYWAVGEASAGIQVSVDAAVQQLDQKLAAVAH